MLLKYINKRWRRRRRERELGLLPIFHIKKEINETKTTQVKSLQFIFVVAMASDDDGRD